MTLIMACRLQVTATTQELCGVFAIGMNNKEFKSPQNL